MFWTFLSSLLPVQKVLLIFLIILTLILYLLHYRQLPVENTDKHVAPREMRMDHQARTLHYFNSYAVRDRIDLSHFSDDDVKSIQLDNVLPTTEDKEALKKNLPFSWLGLYVNTLFPEVWEGSAAESYCTSILC